jgi:hypothetical protein
MSEDILSPIVDPEPVGAPRENSIRWKIGARRAAAPNVRRLKSTSRHDTRRGAELDAAYVLCAAFISKAIGAAAEFTEAFSILRRFRPE